MAFIDASVIVAILKPEPDAEDLITFLEHVEGPLHVSPLVRMEASLSLARAKSEELGQPIKSNPDIAKRAALAVDQFIEALSAQEMPITPQIGVAAREAAQLFGKASGHPAKLNMGDCFAYACAKVAGMPLVFKGEDFVHTDIEQLL
ncbi:type II toxin-antitoxin system VapC family toxin [Rhizobium oryzicola]|uniref:Ribonuclease VapC n=1 Tax=Rhizobium oryzicola TaxID=1232668 RepID=A0ABT8SWK6_9HYPH|nr:type II toxin-antitoxin system VapC family toxin [Rhizobium oryzicola]MDO1582263.1 type II toxin-antitoxin system VapC family toxin [Rhizobium oryzicola]